MGESYAAQAAGGDLRAKAQRFVDIMTSEDVTMNVFKTEADLWPPAITTLDTAASSFRSLANKVTEQWDTQDVKDLYSATSERSAKSLSDSADAIKEVQLQNQYAALLSNVKATQQAAVDALQVIETNESMRSFESTGPNDQADRDAASAGALLAVGQQMDQLNGLYLEVAQLARSMAAKVQWVGAHSDVSGAAPDGDSPGSPGRVPGGTPGNPGGGPSEGQTPAGGEDTAAPGDQGGTPADGGTPGGGTPGSGTPGGTSDPGGPELSGLPPGSVAPPPLKPLTPLTPSTPHIPVDATPQIPLTPVGTAGGAGGLGRSGAGSTGAIGRGGIGAGHGAGGLGESKPAELKAAVRPAQIPQVAPATTSQSAGTGQAPALPPAAGSGTGTTGGTGTGGVPPMMPPMGAAGAGAAGGRGGQPGAGAIRATGRERTRQNGPTPGVPDLLRGKSARKGVLAGTPVTKPAVRRSRDQEPETLQILDEELWSVDPTPAPTPTHRPAT